MLSKKDKLILGGWGIFFGALSVFFAVHWFDWRLVVVIFLALLGNNLSQQK